MSIDLTIVPSRREGKAPEWFLAYDRLTCDQDYDFFDTIKALPSRELPENVTFTWYCDEGCQDTTEDKYGDQLRYVKAGDFKKVKMSDAAFSGKNRGILALLSCLHPSTWVVLWWH